MKTAKEALATHLMMDYSELSDYTYQPGHYSKTVYVVGEEYFCAVKNVSDLPKPTRKDKSPFNWVQVADEYVGKYGWKIFKA